MNGIKSILVFGLCCFIPLVYLRWPKVCFGWNSYFSIAKVQTSEFNQKLEFHKKRDSCDNFVLNQPLLRSPDAPPALAAAGQLADYHLCGTDTGVGWTHGADPRSKTNICLDRSYQSAHHHCNTTLLHIFDQNIRQDRSQQMFARCGHNIKPGTNDDRFAPREPTHNELFSI